MKFIKLSTDSNQSDKEFRLIALFLLTFFLLLASSHLKYDPKNGWTIEIGGNPPPEALAIYGAGCGALGLGFGAKELKKAEGEVGSRKSEFGS